ncbi:MAG TPA: class I SAM-dependent RNA methyltransferase [Blastocatellia bacterium]|nr:class I SAM-dependent RNA methyltransferase [Blastocatellia bacterium]HMV81495.1 class I SAM-dependent RNA methyltransferase [Blastocatellia bacterium]HMX28997.1 class I SAM-dependent RNA methyltransferase [Blastocatellia bacterium]HMY73468.1 class I SAM-dependent RNA methyltransferase [Blastocatellia bacterium]HMZ19937.1 class I SAM-dependent RNA methyltransferase [Blastocatellia bacterium]
MIGEVHEVTIEKLVYGGDGLAHIGSQAVFVPVAAAGDVLRVRLTEVERNYARGVIEEILKPSPVRRTPPCVHFGVCGGCQLQHLDYAAQLNAKVAFVRESLRRLGNIEWESEIAVRAAEEFGYRSRAELKVARDETGKTRIGYFQAGTREVCEVENCLILMPAANRELQRLHAEPSLIPSDATRVHFTVGDEEVIVTPATGENGKSEAVDGLGTAHQLINGVNYGFGVRSFFQGNRLLVEELVNTAIGDARGQLAVDLYAGVGLFSLQLAKTFAQVCAVEGNRPAANHGIENARANNLPNVRYEPISVEAWLKYKSLDFPRPDFVLLDPPRAGAGGQVIERLAALASPRIAYVSCDPSTLARDLRLLIEYGYQIDSITALDMFPQTFHVETVVQLRIAD